MKYTDHPNIHRLRGSISGASGLEAAQKLDPPEQTTPYMPNEVSARGPGYSQPEPSYHQPKPTHQSSVLNMLDEDVEPEQYPLPNRATTEPAPQYDDGSENSAESGRYSPDSHDELHRISRRRSRKFTLRRLSHIFVEGGSPHVFRKGAQQTAASACAYANRL